jgi:FtsP/CotA-like multicopper oxidase with cupredoxin domain
VVNQLRQSTSIHWHGVELESYYDGVPGWGAKDNELTPVIKPGGSFIARFTPPRAGTFMYHTHLNDEAQLSGGLYGPLQWRAMAKDGADLPHSQAMIKDAQQDLSSGEIYDFEYTPREPGRLRLEVVNSGLNSKIVQAIEVQ